MPNSRWKLLEPHASEWGQAEVATQVCAMFLFLKKKKNTMFFVLLVLFDWFV